MELALGVRERNPAADFRSGSGEAEFVDSLTSVTPEAAVN